MEMELPFFYWDPWQSTAAGGGCAIHRVGWSGGREVGDKMTSSWGGLQEGNHGN